jgi:hypothetical protein
MHVGRQQRVIALLIQLRSCPHRLLVVVVCGHKAEGGTDAHVTIASLRALDAPWMDSFHMAMINDHQSLQEEAIKVLIIVDEFQIMLAILAKLLTQNINFAVFVDIYGQDERSIFREGQNGIKIDDLRLISLKVLCAVEPPHLVHHSAIGLWVNNFHLALLWSQMCRWTESLSALTIDQDERFVGILTGGNIFENQSHEYLGITINVQISNPEAALERLLGASKLLRVQWVSNVQNVRIWENFGKALDRYMIITSRLNLLLRQIEIRREYLFIGYLLRLPAQILLITEFIIFIILGDKLVINGIDLLIMIKYNVCHSIEVNVGKRHERYGNVLLVGKHCVFGKLHVSLD